MDYGDENYERAKWNKEIFYLEGELNKCNAKLKVVPEKQRHINTESFVSCTINDSKDMDVIKTEMMKSQNLQEKEKIANVNFAIEKLVEMERLECATSTIKCGEFMGMHYFLMEEIDQPVMDIIVSGKKGNSNTEKYMKITTESNLTQIKLYTILILFAQITELKIFTSTTAQMNIQGSIAIIESCENNILMQLSNLRMEIISERMANTNLYKQAGNGIVVNCLVAIFGQMIPGKEDVYKHIND